MKNIILFSVGLLLLFTVGCKNKVTRQEVETKINQLYSNQESIYGKAVDTNLFSKDLVKKIKNVQEITKADEERIKNSNSPTDKPVMLEGSVFTSLYEGFSKYTIKELSIKDNTAEAVVEFEYNYSTPKIIWSDKVNLVNENGWKIDNVQLYDLKKRLASIIANSKN